MNAKKGKEILAKSVSMLLAIAMLVVSVPFGQVQATEDDPVLLDTVHSDVGEINETYSYFSMGTVQSEVEEQGKYAITIYRDGNVESEASVYLMSADVSAKYGEDYIVEDEHSETTEMETDKTMLELMGDEENQQLTSEIIEEYTDAVESSIEEEETEPSDETELETEDTETKEEGTNSLAEMKENQTGLPTRDTYDTEDEFIEDIVFDNMGIDLGQEIMTSSATQLVFAPGETEKQVVFKVLEDEESEGQELINFLLSMPDEKSELADCFSVGIAINDDEPIEYSEISFSEAEYVADEEQVVVKVVREKALYSLVTVRIHSNELGDAKTGENFAGLDAIIELAPYQEEFSFAIPVRPDGKMAFELVLSEFKGGVEGTYTKAKVLMEGNELEESSENEPVLLSMRGNTEFITIQGVDYELEVDENSSVWRIMDVRQSPSVHVGDYYLPTPVNKTAGDNNVVEEVVGNVEYGLRSGSSGREKNEYNENGQYGHLCWYSGLVWKKGSEIARYSITLPKYQSLYLDYEALSQFQSSECGMKVKIQNEEKDLSQKLEFKQKGYQVRTVSSPILLYGKEDEQTWTPDTWDETTDIDVYAKRAAKRLVEPELKFWGLAAMFKQYEITVEQPDKLEYLNGDGVINRHPARAVLPAGHDVRCLGQDISILYSSTEQGGVINGELIGYKVKFGNDTEYHYYETTEQTLSLSGEFLEFVETYAGENIQVQKSGGEETSFVTKIKIKPVFQYKDVTVQINQSEYGTFDDANLKATTTDVFHVGDKISISATAFERYRDYEFDGYESQAYVNPGDTKPEEAGVVPAGFDLKLEKVKYALMPVFTEQKNIIEIQLDEEAQKYFEVANIVPKEQLTYTDMKGKNVLYIEEPMDGETHTRPVYGKIYEINLVPTDENDGTYRPKITQSYTGNTVNGFCMYVQAHEKADKNVIKVTAEKYNPEDYQLFSIEGYARYATVTLRQSVAGLSNQPAANVSAFTATLNKKLYDNSGNLTWMLQKYAGTNKTVVTTNEQGNEVTQILEGSYLINGIPAISGDTISVKVTNRDVEQVQYVTLTTAGKVQETRNVETLEADEENKKNVVSVKEQICTVVESEPVDMPVRTPYSPYVSDISFAYLKTSVDQSVNSIPIIYGQVPDVLTVSAAVEYNGHDQEQLEVNFVLISKKGTKVLEEKAKYNEETKQYDWDVDPSAVASDGDKIYVQVVSGGIEYTLLNTGLSFYTQVQNVSDLKFTLETGTLAQGVPILSNLDGLVDAGKMKFGMPEYEDPDNKSTSAYSITFSLSVSVDQIADNLETLDKLKNGVTKEGTMSKADSIAEAAKKVTDETVAKALSKRDPNFDKLSDADKQKAIDKNRKSIIEEEKKEAEKNFNESSLAKLNDNFEWDIRVNVLLRLEYMYSEAKNQHIFAGTQYAVGVMADLSKTQYWMMGGYPVYLNMSGWAAFQLDGASTTDQAILTEADVLGYENIAALPVRTSVPWAEFGLGIKLQPGVGICGIVGVRGIFESSALFRVNIDSDLVDKDMHGGVRFEIGGGAAIDLIVLSLEFNVNTYEINTGVYDPDNYEDSVPVAQAVYSNNGTEQEMKIRTYEAVEEKSSLMGKGAMLRSSLEPISKKDLIQGSLEYIRPQMTELPDGRLFMVYLQNGNRQNEADASQLVYSIRNTMGTWSKPVVIDTDNQTAETSPSLLSVDDKIYIAWSYANKPLSGADDLESAKNDLQSLDIKMCVFDAASNSLGKVKTVSSDQFMDNYVRMTEEGENIALYYLKEDLNQVEETNDLASFTSNYNTWAKVLYNPATGEFIQQTVSSGTAVEKLMNIAHPSINDPFVLDYSVATFDYEGTTFGFIAYSVDSDENIETDEDKELWLQIQIDGKSYYPIEIDAGNRCITNLQLTQLDDDVFLTWISDTSVFQSISMKELIEQLSEETAGSGAPTSLEYILASDGVGFDWAEKLTETLDEEQYNELCDFANGKITMNTVDFASPNTSGRKERDIREYSIVQGDDGITYLFWTGATYDPENLGTELFGTSYYEVSEEWQNQWDESMPNTGWGKPVQITNYGSEVSGGLVLDELEIEVQKDKGAVLIVNSYEMDIDETGMVEYGQHNLTEIVCKPISSLKIVDEEIELSEEYPIHGETIDVSFKIKNDGLCPSEGNKVSLSVVKNGKVLAKKEVVETDPEDVIYVGNVFEYSTSLKIPQGLEYPFELRTEVQELVKNDSGEYEQVGRTYAAERTIEYGSKVNIGETYDYNLAELEQFLANKEEGDAEYDAYHAALSNLSEEDEYTHAYFIPVTNVGNQNSEEMNAQVIHIDEEFESGEVMGSTGSFTVNAREDMLICVLVNVEPEYFREAGGVPLGMVETKISVKSSDDGTEVYQSHHTIYENQDIGFSVNDNVLSLEVEEQEQHTLAIKGYPFDSEEKNLFYASMDDEIVAVNNLGQITALKAGQTSVEITDLSTGFKETIHVTVTETEGGGNIEDDDIDDESDLEENEDNNVTPDPDPEEDSNITPDPEEDSNITPNPDPEEDSNITPDPEEDNNVTSEAEETEGEDDKPDSPETGDNMRIGMFVMTALVSGGICMMTIQRKKKYK